MAAVAAGAAVVGAGISVYGQIKAAQDEAEANRIKQAAIEEQIGEITDREMFNNALRDQQTFKNKLDFGSAAAGTGHAGTGIGSQLEIQRQSDIAKATAAREDAFQAHMMRTTGTLMNNAANQAEQAGYIGAGGTILTTAGNLANPKTGVSSWGKTQSLPSVPGGY